MDSSEPRVSEAPPPPGLLDRLWRTVLEPTSLFEALRPRPRWLLVYLVTVALVSLSTWLLFSIQTSESAALLSQSKFLERLPPQAQQEALERARNPAPWQRNLAPVQSSIMVTLVLFVVSPIVWIAQRAFGGEGRFRGTLMVATHAFFVIAGLGSLVLLPLRLLRGSVFEVTLSPAAFLEPDIKSGLYRLLASLDVFSLWGTVVGGIGIAVVARISRAAGLGIAFVLYGAITGILLAIGSLFL